MANPNTQSQPNDRSQANPNKPPQQQQQSSGGAQKQAKDTEGATKSHQEKPGLENEGEGSRTAARHYNDETEQYVKSGRVDAAAQEAKRAVDGPEGDALREAEEKGRAEGVEPGAKKKGA
jgi:hypothetical protein